MWPSYDSVKTLWCPKVWEMNSSNVQHHNWSCLLAVYEKDFQYWQRPPRIPNSGSKQMYTVCKRLNYQSLFMLARTYMDNTGTCVCTKVPSAVLSAFSTKVRVVSKNSGVLFALGFFFECWIPLMLHWKYILFWFCPLPNLCFFPLPNFPVSLWASMGYSFFLPAKIEH